MFKKAMFLSIFLLAACGDTGAATQIPDWVKERAALMQKNPAGEAVREYEYHGQKVYYFLAPCCDQMNDLFDEKGTKLCAPDGGFSGRGDGKCTDFCTSAKPLRTIYEDPANHPAR